MKKIFAISLALILLVSNIGLTLATHFCGGQAVKNEIMLGHNHLDCGVPHMEAPACESKLSAHQHLKAHSCCENQYRILQVEDDFKSNLVQELNLDFALTFVQSFVAFALSAKIQKPQYANYSPPLLLRDIPVLNQVFII